MTPVEVTPMPDPWCGHCGRELATRLAPCPCDDMTADQRAEDLRAVRRELAATQARINSARIIVAALHRYPAMHASLDLIDRTLAKPWKPAALDQPTQEQTT